jgi:type IV pilus assembly protein PilQ
MKLLKIFFLIPIVIFTIQGCLGLPQNAGSDELEPETVAEDSIPDSNSTSDEFSDFNEGNSNNQSDNATTESAPTEVAEQQQETQPNSTDELSLNDELESNEELSLNEGSESNDELSLNDELDSNDELSLNDEPAAVEQSGNDEFAEFEQTEPGQTNSELALDDVDQKKTDELSLDADENAPAAPVQASKSPSVDEIDPFLELEKAAPPVSVAKPITNVNIKSIQYKANESGGAILIQADGPINFITRNNPETEQLVVEIPGALLPERLRRPFNMRDIKGAFGSLDPYQEKGSNVARFVVQLRPNASDPFVAAEGDTLLIVADKSQISNLAKNVDGSNLKTGDGSTVSNLGNKEGILTSRTLQEFLVENSKFYGKKISIETNSMSVRDAIRFISEEGGVNMIISDSVSGNVSIKLKDIPWDQAFIILMKTKSLGYIRIGNVLRVAPLAELRAEEDAAIKLTAERIKSEPLLVKVFAINYAKVDELASRLKDFLSERGKALGDTRTSTVLVTDVAPSLARIEQLIQNLDTQPPQVLIEGRVIEATDSFQRQIGVNWGFGGIQTTIGKSKQGDVTIRPSLNISNGSAGGNTLGFQMGTLDIFGQLSATLSLAENENKIRILASPRIVTLSNENAKITQSIQRPYITTTTAENGTTTSSVTFKNLDLTLDVTPQITSDASVIMTIKVKRDLVGEIVAGQASIESREANTKVMVKNGQTSVIGGVYQNDSNFVVAGVPWLKDIPFLGSLFRFTDTSTRRTELMIFLTPRIVSAGTDSSVNKQTTN